MLHYRSTKGYSEELSKKIGEDFEKEMPSWKTSAPSARAFPRSSATSPRLARGDPSPRRSAPAQDRSWTKALGTCWRRTSKSDHRCDAARLLHKVSRRTAIPLPLFHILPANQGCSEELPDLDSNQD